MIDYDKFQKSLKHLELQYRNHKSMDSGQPKLIWEAVTASVIQSFETCYDSLGKFSNAICAKSSVSLKCLTIRRESSDWRGKTTCSPHRRISG